MAIGIWKHSYVVRRYTTTYQNGYQVPTATDSNQMLDIQTTSDSQAMTETGDHSVARIKAFGDFEFRVANGGLRADKVYFNGKWYECIASRYSGNTIIHHWTSEFVECEKQESAPSGG